MSELLRPNHLARVAPYKGRIHRHRAKHYLCSVQELVAGHRETKRAVRTQRRRSEQIHLRDRVQKSGLRGLAVGRIRNTRRGDLDDVRRGSRGGRGVETGAVNDPDQRVSAQLAVHRPGDGSTHCTAGRTEEPLRVTAAEGHRLGSDADTDDMRRLGLPPPPQPSINNTATARAANAQNLTCCPIATQSTNAK